jgi:inorganic pyrophosphatase
MPNLQSLPTWTKEGLVHVVVETPRGARAKVKYDPELRVMMLTKPLILGLSLPYDFGFIPSTHAEDGDPLDALVLHQEASFPGIVIRCRPVGVVKVRQREKGKRKPQRNDRIIAVPDEDHREQLADARELPRDAKKELEAYFSTSVVLKQKELEFIGWGGPEEAERLIRQAERAFREKTS